MAKMRKTVDVQTVKNSVNTALNNWKFQNEFMGAETAQAYRQGICSVLDTVLYETGNYRGFQITDPNAKRTEIGYLVDGEHDDSIRNYY